MKLNTQITIIISIFSLFFLSCGKKDKAPVIAKKESLVQSQSIETQKMLKAIKSLEDKIETLTKKEHEDFLQNLHKLNNNPNDNLTLKTNALEKLFLMTMAHIQGVPAPIGSALASKIVFFSKKNGMLNLYESSQGKILFDSIKTKTPLAQFKIIEESKDEIVIDFKGGMKLVFFSSSSYVSDFPKENRPEVVAEVTHNFIEKIKNLENGAFFIEQFVRVNQGKSNHILHLKYSFSEYTENKNFSPRPSTKMEKVGYFEIAPVIDLKTEKEKFYIQKFDLSKPLTYHLTNNIPANYLKAVQDGVLYWNKVFGKEVIKVATLPKEASVHDMGYNIVQWVKWDTAGFAKADMAANPLTGEIVQAHVYMTSTFARGGIKTAKRLYKNHLDEEKNESSVLSAKISGMLEQHICSYSEGDALFKQLGNVLEKIEGLELSSKDEEAMFLKFSQDYIASVVAHEVGHTLGMRHNFAGSLVTTIMPEELDGIFEKYLKDDVLSTEIIFADTVMDYTNHPVSSFIGAAIRKKDRVLSYDLQAMKYAYPKVFGIEKIKVSDLDINYFCTDSHRSKGTYADCIVWDIFPELVKTSGIEFQKTKKVWARSLTEKFSFLNKRDKISNEEILVMLKNISLSPEKDTTRMMNNFFKLVSFASKKTEFIQVKSKFSNAVTKLDKKDYLEATEIFKQNAFDKEGGLAKLTLNQIQFSKEGNILLFEEIEKSVYEKFNNLYKDLSEDELKIAYVKIQKYFAQSEVFFLNKVLEDYSKQKLSVLDDAFPSEVERITDKILFSKKEILQNELNQEQQITSVLFEGERHSLRKSAVALLSSNFYELFPHMHRKIRKTAMNSYKKYEEEKKLVLDGKKLEDISDSAYNWLFKEEKLYTPLKRLTL